MKISIITPRFIFSGVPLAQHRFARAWAEAGHQVELVIGLVEPGYEVPPIAGVTIHELGEARVRRMFGPIRRHLRTKTPDIVFTAEDHLSAITLLAGITAGVKTRISCSSRVTPFDTYRRKSPLKAWALKQLMRAVMWRADALTCVSADMVEQYREVFPRGRHTHAYNIVVDDAAKSRMTEAVDEPWFDDDVPVLVAAGTLAPWKGFDVLLDAVARVRAHRPVRLILLGDGPSRADLEAQAKALGLTDHVRFTGYIANPLKYFARADAFVLSSRVEGLPNVLVEAMMCGCTPVSTDCPTGPREVLDGGRYGYMGGVDDSEAMATNIVLALDHPVPRTLLDEAVRPFTTQAVLERHLELLGIDPAARPMPTTGPIPTASA